MLLRPGYAVSDVYLLWQPTLWWMYARDCLRNVGLGIGTADVDAKVDAMTKLQAEFEKGSEVRPAPFEDPAGEFVEPPVLVGETAVTEPTVAEGAGPFAPFMAIAVDESCAKPTEAGFER